MVCPNAPSQNATKTSIWNPLPSFTDVTETGQRRFIQPAHRYFESARAGTLPAVSWVIPSEPESEHPPALVSRGQDWVTTVVNAVMNGPDWDSTAIFVLVGRLGWLLRPCRPPTSTRTATGCACRRRDLAVRGKGFIDHQMLASTPTEVHRRRLPRRPRLDPDDRRPAGPRPEVREDAALLGDLSRTSTSPSSRGRR